jgi:hypothetical protein
MQNHYPERLGTLVIVDAPRVFSLLWRAAKSVMASNTLDKCVFLSGQDSRDAMAAVLFDGKGAAWLQEIMALNR